MTTMRQMTRVLVQRQHQQPTPHIKQPPRNHVRLIDDTQRVRSREGGGGNADLKQKAGTRHRY